MNEAVQMICAQDVRTHIDANKSLEDRIKDAFVHVQDFWLSTDEKLRFGGALAAIYLDAAPAERDRLKRSSDHFHLVQAALVMGRILDVEKPDSDNISLLKLWGDAVRHGENKRNPAISSQT